MDFENNNLTKEFVVETLELVETAINYYNTQYKNKLYKFTVSSGIVSVVIRPHIFPHLLGFDVDARNTWLEYIGKNRPNSFEWFKEFVSAKDFINYMIFSKKEDPLVNFFKMRYKAQVFCEFNINNSPAFIFDSGGHIPMHVGVVNDSRIVSLKITREQKYDEKSINIPASLYVYDKNDPDFKNKEFRKLQIPSGLKIYKKRECTDISHLYTEEYKEEVKEKIRNLMK